MRSDGQSAGERVYESAVLFLRKSRRGWKTSLSEDGLCVTVAKKQFIWIESIGMALISATIIARRLKTNPFESSSSVCRTPPVFSSMHASSSTTVSEKKWQFQIVMKFNLTAMGGIGCHSTWEKNRFFSNTNNHKWLLSYSYREQLKAHYKMVENYILMKCVFRVALEEEEKKSEQPNCYSFRYSTVYAKFSHKKCIRCALNRLNFSNLGGWIRVVSIWLAPVMRDDWAMGLNMSGVIKFFQCWELREKLRVETGTEPTISLSKGPILSPPRHQSSFRL